MACSVIPTAKCRTANIVTDEKFAQIYTPDEEAVQLLDNETTVMIVRLGIFSSALGIHSYSSGTDCIRIRRDEDDPVFGVRSRSIAPVPDEYRTRYYGGSPSTYGWTKTYIRICDGVCQTFGFEQLKKLTETGSRIYTFTLNCDEHRLNLVDENTKEEDEIDVDVCKDPLPWCFFVSLPRTRCRMTIL